MLGDILKDLEMMETTANSSSIMDPCLFSQTDYLSEEFPDMSIYTSGNNNNSNCTGLIPPFVDTDRPFILVFGENMYVWVTPVILIIGILGNSLSLSVFTSKNMRSLSASNYLAALSLADLLTLIFYVFIQWLTKGLKLLPGNITIQFFAIHGFCQIFMYLGYIFRFLSAWLVVIFTVERYIGVCHPLRRRSISTSSSRKIILCLVLVAAILLVYKPILSGSLELKGEYYCISYKEYRHVSEILDSIYGVFITLVPFILITGLNLLIIRKLVQRNRRQRQCSVMTEESIIRLEFTIILLAISLCFIAFNLPYFVIWIQFAFKKKEQSKAYDPTKYKNLAEHMDYQVGVWYIVRAIFYFNYCVNFFLYSITGAYFRREVRMIFRYKMGQNEGYAKCSQSQTQQSWV